jgi:hypothetical protein
MWQYWHNSYQSSDHEGALQSLSQINAAPVPTVLSIDQLNSEKCVLGQEHRMYCLQKPVTKCFLLS